MLVKFLIEDIDADDNSISKWKDLYIDQNRIYGFYIPEIDEEEHGLGASINVLYCSTVMTFKQEDHLLDYLEETFVKEKVS